MANFLIGAAVGNFLAAITVIVVELVARARLRRGGEPARAPKVKRRAAFIVIKSAEGRRSGLRRNISAEELERQRDALHQAGIRRIEPALGRHQLTPPTDNSWGL